MKKILALAMVMVLLLTAAACGGDSNNSEAGNQGNDDGNASETAAAEDGSGSELTIWSAGDELERFVEGFNEVYPDITVNITVVPNEDFLAKLTPALSSGQDVPDIFTGESDYVKYLVDSPYWDDLREEPYNVEQYTDDIWEYVVSAGTDDNGAIKALSWQASPGSIIYRRDMAEAVLGSGEPEDVSALLTDNNKMLEVAEQLKENGITMFASWQDLLNMQFSNRESAWIEDDKLMIGDDMLDFMDMAKEIVEKGYSLNADPWSPEWSAVVESEDTFCYVLPTWGYQFVVKPSADTTVGKWGLAEAVVPYVKGGTWMGIYSESPNKDAAWKFMEYVCCNSEAQQAYATEYAEYVSLRSANEALAEAEGEEVLAGQNLYEFYNSQMEKIPEDLMTAYDGTINDAFLDATKLYAAGTLSKDEAVQQFKDDVTNAYPDIAAD